MELSSTSYHISTRLGRHQFILKKTLYFLQELFSCELKIRFSVINYLILTKSVLTLVHFPKIKHANNPILKRGSYLQENNDLSLGKLNLTSYSQLILVYFNKTFIKSWIFPTGKLFPEPELQKEQTLKRNGEISVLYRKCIKRNDYLQSRSVVNSV